MYTRWDLGRSLEARVGKYDAALRAWECDAADEVEHAEREAVLRRLADEHEFRMLEWCRRLRIQPCETITELPPRMPNEQWWWLVGLLVAVPMMLLSAKLVGNWGMVAAAAGVGVWCGARRVRGFSKPPKTGWRTQTLLERACSSCDYDLSGHGDAIPAGALRGWKVGLQRCSECGAVWPLAPGR